MTADRDVSTEARSAKPDHLDEAIDRVAKRLTQVEEDSQLAARIAAALPERFTWFGWLTGSWAPRVAMLAIIAGTLALWTTRHTTERTAPEKPLASAANTNWPQLVPSIARDRELRSTLEPEPEPEPEPNRTKPLEPGNPGTVEPFDGLPSVAVPKALMVLDITPEPLPGEGALAVSSLVIADLPLTTESFSQRD